MKIKKRIGQRVRSNYSCKLHLLNELRDMTIYQNMKKIEKVYITVCIPLRRNPFQERMNDKVRVHLNLKTTEI